MDFKIKHLKYILPVLLFVLLLIFVKVQKQNACTITPAVLRTASVDDSTVDLSWTNGQNSKVTYLNVSTSKSLKPDGSLELADIVDDVVTGQNSYSKNDLGPGIYYWNIVSDGCGQRKVTELGTFTVQSTADADSVTDSNTKCEITPAILDNPIVKDEQVTLSWANSQGVKASYINISTSKDVDAKGILQKVDIANDVVTDKKSYTRENLSSGTYYWNIASDGCNQRKMSDLGSFVVQSALEE